MAFRTSQFYRTGSNLTFSGQYLFTFICFCAVLFQKNRKKTAKKPLKGLLSQEKLQKNCKARQRIPFGRSAVSKYNGGCGAAALNCRL